MRAERIGSFVSNFQWAIVEEGNATWGTPDVVSQARFESESAAQIAYRNYLLSRKGA